MNIGIWDKELLPISKRDKRKEEFKEFVKDTKFSIDDIGLYSIYGEVMLNPCKNKITNRWVAMTR